MAFGFGQVAGAGAGRSGPSGRWGRGRRAAPWAPRARGADRRRRLARKSGLARLGKAGDPVAGRDGEQVRGATGLAAGPRRQPAQLVVDLDHRLVEKGGGTGEELDRVKPRQLGAGSGDRPRPLRDPCPRGSPPGAAAVPGSRSAPAAAGCPPPAPPPVLPQTPAAHAGSPGSWPCPNRPGSRYRHRWTAASRQPRPTSRDQDRDRQDRARMAGRPARDCAQSIESGPLTSALRNCDDELVFGVEQLFFRTRLDDFAAPQHGEEVSDPPRRVEVVADRQIAAAVLGVHLADQLAKQRGADGVEAGVGLVEHDDRGSSTSARAKPARLRIPPESSFGIL